MIQPIDYTTGAIQNPLQSFVGGMNLGNSIIQSQQDRAMAELARQKKEQDLKRQEQVNSFYARLREPGATVKDYENLSMLLPEKQAESLREGYKMRTEAEQAADLSDTSQVFSAFKAGKTDIGVSFLKRQAEAERNSGNDQGALDLEKLVELAESGEDGANAVEDLLGFNLSMMPGGKDALESAVKYADEVRKKQEQPILMAQKQAELDSAKSKAEEDAIKAKYAEKEKIAELKKYGDDSNLTVAETNETIARTKKIGVEISKLLMEMKALEKTGGITPEKKFEQEEKIRKEYQGRVSNYNEMTQTFDKLQASAYMEGGAGDIALVTGFMKMLDPGSVVRETEFATARDTGGLSAQLYALSQKYNPKTKGSFLKPEQKKQFLALAKQYMDAANKHEEKVRQDLGNVVEDYGLSEKNIFGNVTTKSGQIKKEQPSMYRNEVDALSAASRQTGSNNVVEVDW